MEQKELSFEEEVRAATEVLKQDMERIERGILSGELIPMPCVCLCSCCDGELEDLDELP